MYGRMKLTRYTDYALRVLMHLAVRPEGRSSIAEIARTYAISRNHLMKVVHDLAKAGYVDTLRGRGGGIRLARPPEEINVGGVVRHTEGDFDLVGCGSCVIARACGLTGVLDEALGAFLATLESYTVADIVRGRAEMLRGIADREFERAPELV